MENNAQERRNSLQYHFAKSPMERQSTPRRSRDMKMPEKERTLRSSKVNAPAAGSDWHASSVGSVSSMPSGSYQKPRPGRKATGAVELVKHMSKVPSYLQQVGRGDNIQEKALNFGVLDWGLLEEWTKHQKHVANGRGENSSSISNKPSSFSTFGSSSIQSRGSTDSPIPRRKQSASRDGHRNPSVMGSLTQLMEKKSSEPVLDFQDSRTSAINFSTGHDQHLDADHGTGADHMRYKHIKDKGKNSGSEDDGSRKTGQKQCQTLLQNKECMSDHLKQSVHVRCGSFDSLLSNDIMPAERFRNSFSGSFPEDVQSTYQSPHVPHSRRLPRAISTHGPASASTILQENKVVITRREGQNGEHGQFTSSSCEQFQVNVADKSGRKLPNHLSVAGRTSMSRSSCEGSSVRQSKKISCPGKSDGDKATTNNRSWHSPLRRILDPLLKPKHNIQFSGPTAASPVYNTHELNDANQPLMREESALSHRPYNSSDAGINFTGQSNGNLNSSSQVPNGSKGSHQHEGQLASTRQALLQLAWKNGLPLFMFSSIDGDILAATVSKKSVSNRDDCKCIYTIFSVHEVKKKSSVWINPGSKSKKHGLLSNVVGRLKVSSSMLTSHDSKSHFVVREFVLLGSDLATTSHESVGTLFNSELAAIITQNPQGSPMIHCSNCKYSLPTNSAEKVCCLCQEKRRQVGRNDDNSSLSTVTAILPSGIHGLSDEAGPSPLIQRWKSGGACDCGGWDEGCMLTILTNNQEKRSSCLVQASCTTDGTHQFELFIEGRSHESKHAFSVVSLKEGLYTVDFMSSIALVQAFAIGIATLHARKPTNHAVEEHTLQEHIFAENFRQAPASYVPNHPPLSPVGRA